MVATLLTQAVFIIVLLLCPWRWLANLMEIELMDLTDDPKKNIFRMYMLLIPIVHLLLAIAIEVSHLTSYKLGIICRN